MTDPHRAGVDDTGSGPAASDTGPTVAEVGEFGVIGRAVTGRVQPDTTLVGPGDDAAVVRAPDGRVAVSTDMLVEGRHFRWDWSAPEDVGRKAIAQNAADVAAVGARPTAFLVALGCPPRTPARVLDALSDGIGRAAEELGAGVVGGDLVQAEQIVVSVTVLGDLGGRPPVRRGGAREGDVVAVAGELGASAAGLALLGTLGVERATELYPELVRAHRIPTPPYRAAEAAARAGVHAMTDVSDGLVADLRHIAVASGVSIVIDAVPAPQALVEPARSLGVDPASWVLGGGEDHAFAATFAATDPLPPGWTRIGYVRAGSGGVTVTGAEPHDVDTEDGGGWQSFSP
ncbi:thiamine-phosphate kinase [Rhodococcus triatomae]|uniref:thiamine-phosphate kinase n=1 Tax=Rhodococcus triatomae TaxID=300028 RepID=UPI0009356194|nr:thiamine-phosphate kinase [Rhodococcus triatomae]